MAKKKILNFGTVIHQEDVDRTLKVLEDNGIAKEECYTVLQAICYTLLDLEIEDWFPEKDNGKKN